MTESVPLPFVRQLLRSYTIGYLHIRAFTDDLTEADARETPGGQFPVVWYVAHLICAHDHFLDLYTEGHQALDGEFVQAHATACNMDFTKTPPLAELLVSYEAMYLKICDYLATIRLEDLAREPHGHAGHPSFGCLGSALAVISFHDGYHAGQLAMLRMALGKPDIADHVDLMPIV